MDSDSTDEPLTEHRNNVIHYILNNSSSKIPIKQPQIVARALNGNISLFREVVEDVVRALRNTYGIELKTVPDTKSVKMYICHSRLPAVSSTEFDKEQRSNITLLFIVLSYIFMKGAAITEECLEDFLRGLRIYFDGPHEYFGPNVKKLITETFVKQLYLKKTKDESNAVETTYLYTWGFRSTVEFNKSDVLEVVSKILNKPAKQFVMQYTQAHSTQSTNSIEEYE